MVEMRLVGSVMDVQTLTAAECSEHFDRAVVQFMQQLRPGSTQSSSRWLDMEMESMVGHGDGYCMDTC